MITFYKGIVMRIIITSNYKRVLKSNMKIFSYDNEMSYLRDYLRNGFDAYDYTHRVFEFLENEGEAFNEDDIDGSYWVDNATSEQLKSFKEYITSHPEDEGINTPAYQHLDFKKVQKAGWLVHFTNNAYNIVKEGFLYGHEEFTGLGLTTWKSEEYRKKYSGYNFAFDIDSKYAKFASGSGIYGKEAVVFWGSGIKAYHWGDEEDQILFYGPSVKKDMIFQIYQSNGQWVTEDYNGRIMKGGSFEEVVDWVTHNYRTLQQIKKKYSK